jgi:hypothetical protein
MGEAPDAIACVPRVKTEAMLVRSQDEQSCGDLGLAW